MSVKTFDKDPAEVLDYGFDLTHWLTGGEIVNSVQAFQDPALLTLGDIINTGEEIAVWVGGGTIGDKVDVALEAVTNSNPPRTFRRSVTIYIKKR